MRKWISVIFLGLFLIIVIYVVVNLSTGRTTFFGKAANSGVFNPTNSYIFASPLSVRAGGDKVRVTVFALDGQGKGIPKKSVVVSCKDPAACQAAGITFVEVQPQTDTLGRAIYDLTAQNQGKFELQASVEGVIIPQTVTVIFR